MERRTGRGVVNPRLPDAPLELMDTEWMTDLRLLEARLEWEDDKLRLERRKSKPA